MKKLTYNRNLNITQYLEEMMTVKFLHKLSRKEYIQWTIAICLAICCVFCTIMKGIENPSFIETYKKNNTARIDIGISKGKDIEISTNIKDKIDYPIWLKNQYGQGFVANFDIEKNWKNFKIDLTSNSDGEIQLRLLGPDKRINNERYPVIVEYRNLKINGKLLDKKDNFFWYDKPFRYNIDVKKDIPVKISVDIKIPSLTLKDIYRFNQISIYLLFSLFILLIFIFRKVIHYLSKFKQKCFYSRIDIVMLVIFFGLLCLPMCHISQAEKSEQENRMLAKKPQLIIAGGGLNNFGLQFDAWFNDHFFGRETIVKLYQKLRYNFISTYYITPRGCANKKTKWVGSCGYSRKMFSQKELLKTLHSINKLQNFATKNNIKVYFLIAPSQGSIYGKNILPWYKNNDEIERNYQMVNFLKKHNISVVYLYKEILEASQKDYMFFKTDTHWTDSGAFIAYYQIMKLIKEDFNDIHIMQEDDFNYQYSNMVKVQQENGFHKGRNYNLIGLNDDRFFDVKYKYFIHKDINSMIKEISFHGEESYIIRKFKYNKEKYNLTLFGDSFGENLEPIIPYSFNNTLRIYTWVPSDDFLEKNLNIQRFENQILKNNTDILIICFSQIDRLMYLYKD